MKLSKFQEPSVRDRMRHNLLPSGTERAAILDSINVARTRLLELEAQHPTPSDPLNHNVEEADLRRYISDYSSLLAPIRLLSEDVLQMIFLDPDIHNSSRTNANPPRTVMDVYEPHRLALCHHWRNVVCGTPIFWSSLEVLLTTHRSRNSIHRLRLCLQRSKTASLSILFKWDPSYYHLLPAGNALHDILEHAERWARITVPLEPRFAGLLSPALGRLHRLQTIILYSSPYTSSLGERPFGVFEDVPKLRSLSLHCSPDSSAKDLLGLQIPWHQIQCLSIHCQGVGRTSLSRQILEMTPNLRECTIRCTERINWAHFEPAIPKTFPEMRTLILDGAEVNRRGVTKMLNHMKTPALKDILIVNSIAWDSPSMSSLLQRSGCHLERLVLQNTHVRPQELLSLLCAIPTLHTLVMTDLIPTAITDIVVEALTSCESTASLPALTTLVVTGAYLFKTDKLMTMLESRTGPDGSCCSLGTIDITLPSRQIAAFDLERFAALGGAEFLSLVCLDETKMPVRIPGRQAVHHDWRYTSPLLGYCTI